MRQNKFSVFSKRIIISSTVIGIMLICALAWRFTPLKQQIKPLHMINAGQELENRHVMALLLVMGIYLLANLIIFPVTGLIIATLVVFGPLFGYLYALGGMLLSAITAYGVGYALGYKLVQRWKGRWARKVNRHLERRGFLSMFVLRLLPVAPFTLINLLAGASHLRFVDYAMGSLLGFITNLLTITFIYIQIEMAVATRDVRKTIIAIGAVLLILALLALLRRHLERIEFSSFQKKSDE